jgi:ubiquinone/menaquinone biosynthesis C-methylase UbiE
MGAKRVVSDYNTTAGIYEARYSGEQAKKIGFLLNRLRPEGGAMILDIGCGTGMLVDGLRDSTNIVGIDPSIRMLQLARQRGYSALILADAGHIPVISGAADYVFSVSVLQLLEDPREGAREMLRVLREGGWIGVSALLKSFTGESLKELFGIVDGEVFDSETMKDAFLIANKHRSQNG